MRNKYYNQQFSTAVYPLVFVINLRSSAERRNSIRGQLDKIKIPYVLVTAVDGKQMTEDTLVAYNYFKNQRQELPVNNTADLNVGKNFRMPPLILERDMAAGEIGCFLSHCKIYAHIVEHKIPFSVILEDDVLLSPNFGETLLELKHYYHRYAIIYLGALYFGYKSLIEEGCPVSLWGRKKVTSATKLGHFIDTPFGSHGYAVSWQGACSLLSLAVPMSTALDALLVLGLYDNRYKIAGIKPDITVQDPAKKSTIDEQRMAYHALAKALRKRQREKRFTLLHRFGLAVRHFRKRLRTTMLQIFLT